MARSSHEHIDKNVGGRPPTFESEEDMHAGRLVEVKDLRDLSTNDFKSEKELMEYIKLNMEKFCTDVLNDKLVSYESEVCVKKHTHFSARPNRCDLVIKCKKYNYVVELKNPTTVAENKTAIGQLLSYGAELIGGAKLKLVLVTTKFDMSTANAIKAYKLPIDIIYLDKTRSMRFIGNQ